MIKCFFVWLHRADFICMAAGRRKMITLVLEMINVEYHMKNDKGVFFVRLFRADFICLTAGRCKMIAMVL